MAINTVSVSGNLTKEPELRQAGSSPLLTLRLAVNERVKHDGEWVDRPNYFDVLVWGARGESLSRILSKGSKVAIAGRLRWSEWEKDGDRRSKVEIVANDVELLSRGDSGEKREAPADDYFNDSEIPF